MFFYCEGWVLSERRPYPLVWHTGGTTGNNTIVAFVPQAGVGLVMLANLNSGLPFDLTWTFYDRFFGNPPRDWRQIIKKKEADEKAAKPVPKTPAAPAPPLPLERYTGAYANPVYGQLNIVADNGALAAVCGPRKSRQPWPRGTGTPLSSPGRTPATLTTSTWRSSPSAPTATPRACPSIGTAPPSSSG